MIEDLKSIAKLFSGNGNVSLPESIKINEGALYECCYEMGWDTSVLDSSKYQLEVFVRFLDELTKGDRLVLFVDYYFNKYIESKIDELTIGGYKVFGLKDKILISLNSLWSIPNQEFGIVNGNISMVTVEFKEYDKMGEGGFCTVYRSPIDTSLVYKVLNTVEKTDAGSIHRVKREFDIMNEQNSSGYTLKVYDYDSKALIYSMEKARTSLEEFIGKSKLKDREKDEIVIRCTECMRYLHSKGIIHRDFHPGNILQKNSGEWVVTDFGLAKDISSKYSHQTTTTHAVGRAWFTDPTQLFALKDGNFKTDMFSLAKTIDYIMAGDMSGTPHKYSSIVYKATAPNPDNRYNEINEMYEDLIAIYNREEYESPKEITKKLIEQFRKDGQLDVIRLISFLNEDTEGELLWNLIVEMKEKIHSTFMNIIDVSFEVALREIRKVSITMQEGYHDYGNYSVVASWAISIISGRQNKNDEINIEAAQIIEYAASNVGRYDIQRASNTLKSNSQIDGHIRAQLTYHDGY